MGSVEAELIRTLAPLALVAARSWAILRAQVLWRSLIGGLWWLVALGIAVATAPLGPVVTPPGSVSAWLVAALAEVALGTAIGYVVSLPGYALLGAAAVQAKVLRTATAPWVALTAALVGALALLSGLHRPLLDALTQTYEIFEVAAPAQWLTAAQTDGLRWVVRALHVMLVLALAFATPVLLAAAVVESGLGLAAAGGGPAAMPVRALQAWLRVAAALVALGAGWAAYPQAWTVAALPPAS